MESINIEKLIEKYFEGNTSLEDEANLRKFFTTQEVPVHLEAYQDLFGYFKTKRLETFEKQVLPTKKNVFTFRGLSIAASIALLIGFFILNPFTKEPSKEELVKNYQTAQQALDLISESLNKGAFAMAQLEEFDRAKEMVFKNNDK
ncbi:MAG: hypothetical protein L3J45_05380 [Flavobacteriaceae bacterium]|nr:hypothetical protein [Flavobacteriaceae bacterium]